MSGITQFEVQVQQGGRWSIHAQFGPFQKEAATNEAKQIAQTPGFSAVKVVREVYDPDKGVSHEFVVWKSSGMESGGGGGGGASNDSSSYDDDHSEAAAAAPSWTDDEDEVEADDFGNPIEKRKKSTGSATLTQVIVKLLFVALFSVAIAAFFTFLTSAIIGGKTMFGMRITGNLEANILFVVFFLSFFVSAGFLAVGSLKKTQLKTPKRRQRAPKPAPQPVAKKKKKKKPGRGAADGPSLSDDAAELQRTVADDTPAETEPANEEPKAEGEAPASGLSPNAEKQKAFMMETLKQALSGETSGKKLDNFNKFGVNLWLAGACEVLSQKRGVDDASQARILADSVQVMGFKKSHAGAFSEKYEEYLMQDSRYMQMFQAGRNAMSLHMTEPGKVSQHLDQALGEWNKPKAKKEAPKIITVLFTDIAGSTAMTQALGDAGAQEVVRAHNRVVREALTQFRGREVKHTGDGIMASFDQASDSVDAAIMMQRGAMAHNQANPSLPLHLKIGINSGEPIQEDNDLFGTTVQMSARIVDKAQADEIFVSEIVRGICAGKSFEFVNRGGYPMKGFDGDITLFEAVWRQAEAAE